MADPIIPQAAQTDYERKLSELRGLVDEGIADLESGRYTDGEEFFAQLLAKDADVPDGSDDE